MKFDRCCVCDYTGWSGSALLDQAPHRGKKVFFREDYKDVVCDDCYGDYTEQLSDYAIKDQVDESLGENEPTLSLWEEQ